MSKPLNLTGHKLDSSKVAEYLYQDELQAVLKRIYAEAYIANIFDKEIVAMAERHLSMELRSISAATRGQGDPYTEADIREVFLPTVVLPKTIPYGYYYHKALTENGFRVTYADVPNGSHAEDTDRLL